MRLELNPLSVAMPVVAISTDFSLGFRTEKVYISQRDGPAQKPGAKISPASGESAVRFALNIMNSVVKMMNLVSQTMIFGLSMMNSAGCGRERWRSHGAG